jgi:hypothetical protein
MALRLSELRVWLLVGYRNPDDGYTDPSLQATKNLKLSPGDRRTFTFAFNVPKEAPLSRTCVALGPRETVYSAPKLAVYIWPEPRFVDLARQLAAVSGHNIHSWRSAGAGDGVYAQLMPQPAMRPLFDSVALELFPDGTSIYGSLIVDPQERNLADVLRAATLSDIQRYLVRFSASQLPDAGKEFERLLRPFMDRGRNLPIPAAGVERDDLPRTSGPPALDMSKLPIPDPSVPAKKR